ncbi:MAG: twin-arginine translocation signal domain-containing protein [Planctomycetota bacterium]|jgi:anaerobic selenocysteine-containing dehydrogenase
MNRRDFLKNGSILAVGGAVAYGLPLLTRAGQTLADGGKKEDRSGVKWGMVIDLGRCDTECDACVKACRDENNVAFHENKDIDIYWIRKAVLKRQFPAPSGEIPQRPVLQLQGRPRVA